MQLDTFGKPLPVGHGRAIQTLVWYPARKAAGPRMQVADYREASPSDVDFAFSGAEAAR